METIKHTFKSRLLFHHTTFKEIGTYKGFDFSLFAYNLVGNYTCVKKSEYLLHFIEYLLASKGYSEELSKLSVLIESSKFKESNPYLRNKIIIVRTQEILYPALSDYMNSLSDRNKKLVLYNWEINFPSITSLANYKFLESDLVNIKKERKFYLTLHPLFLSQINKFVKYEDSLTEYSFVAQYIQQTEPFWLKQYDEKLANQQSKGFSSYSESSTYVKEL